ncbi:MAG: hypothetical protein ACYDBQ_00540 [Thermoplasmatota archaeon]
MARDEGKGEDYQFVPPDFDEEAFIHQEVMGFRAGVAILVWGILCALLSWGIFVLLGGSQGGWLAGLAVMVLFGFLIKPLYARLKIDTARYKRMNWTGAWFFLFLTWLAIFMLLINPPLGDYSAPQVFVAGSSIQVAGAPVQVDAVATDNVRVTESSFHAVDAQGTDWAAQAATANLGGGHMRYMWPSLPTGHYVMSLEARDHKGYTSTTSANLTVSNDTLTYHAPPGNSLGASTAVPLPTPVEVTVAVPPCDPKVIPVSPCLRFVALVPTDGAGNVTLQYQADSHAWVAWSNYGHWNSGMHSFRVVAQPADQQFGNLLVASPAVQLAGLRSLNVTVDPAATIQTVAPLNPLRATPGLELAAVVVVLALLVLRRR